jgi:hypothetical protein
LAAPPPALRNISARSWRLSQILIQFKKGFEDKG